MLILQNGTAPLTHNVIICFLPGVTAIGARIFDTGTVAYFPPEWAVYATGDHITMNFGAVNNVASDDTVVVVELNYAIVPGSTMASNNTDIELRATIGGEEVPDLRVVIETNVSFSLSLCKVFPRSIMLN